MIVYFNLRFSSKFGQTLYISGNIPELGSDNLQKAIPLTYINNNFWGTECLVNTTDFDNIQYKYILKDVNSEDAVEFGDDKIIEINTTKQKFVTLDTWQNTSDYKNNFYTQAFQNVLLPIKQKAASLIKKGKKYTHIFKVKVPILQPNEVVCLLGSCNELGSWDNSKPILLALDGNWWTTKITIENTPALLEYKYGIYNTKAKKFVQFEADKNRILADKFDNNTKVILHDGYASLPNQTWKGAGVAIPLFSLRSKNSFGVGEFSDINLLVDWAKQCGLKLIQLLPINDTIATHSWKDSYPYAAISAFALHPQYINLQEVAGKQHQAIIKPLLKKQKQLNALPDVDYEQVIKFKLSALKELYAAQKNELKEDINYFNFFELNRHWLVPYAAFCYLRDKNNTCNFTDWRSNSKYNETAIQRLVSPSQKHYDEIAVHYFTQYHLHLQLKAATAYAHKNAIVVKGDIPIGIYRNSVDAWIDPTLYNMNEQAGAPPDDFAVKGQNWGFPTYNWKKMQEDGFTWWRQRFEQMSNYFDAFRIDHILGFFRIWSIPLHAVEGILGRFVPALPIHLNELAQKGIYFNYERFCKPYITDGILYKTFGSDIEFAKNTFFNGLQLKEEFNTQRKVEQYFAKNKIENASVLEGLYNIISNVILIEEEGSEGKEFHFRISVKDTQSFKHLDADAQQKLEALYTNYFYYKQDEFWKKEAMQKLPGLKRSTNMLICGEDLGMVPHCVPEVMEELSILSLEIQRMPKAIGVEYLHPKDAPYLSVITPSTHDMSTIRGWWMEDKEKIQRFYTTILGKSGDAPYYCEPWINQEIVWQHLQSPAMWSIFQLQDLLGCNDKLRRQNADEERINIPANPNHYWRYRMHIFLEDLLKEKAFSKDIKEAVATSGR